jgi:hypothetical protein
VAGTVVLLAGGAGVVGTKLVWAGRGPDIQGAWEGTMLLDEAGVGSGETSRTRVVLKLTRTNGIYRATTDWVDIGRKDVPLGKVVYQHPSLLIDFSIRDRWKLTVNSDGTQMLLDHAIHFVEPAPVLFLRTASPTPVPERLAESQFSPRADSDLQGYWKAELGPEALPLAVKIAEGPDRTFLAEGDDPMQGVNGRPVAVVYSGPRVKLMPATGTGMFEGTLNQAHTEMAGVFTQGGQSMPATLKRADYQAEHTPESFKDYSFRSRNELVGHWRGTWEVTFGNTRVPIRMALHVAKLPDGAYAAGLSNLDEFGHEDPVPPSEFHYELATVRMGWKWAGDTRYEGRLQDGKLVGTWYQGGGGFPLVFERTE